MTRKSLIAASTFAILTAILLGAIAEVRQAPADQDEQEENQQAAKRPSWVSVENGRTVLTLDAATRARAQISVGAVEAASARQKVAAPAAVLSAQDLISQRNATLVAQTRIEKAEASLAVSRREYERLTALYKDNQNASEKALQAAEGTLKSDQAEAQAARQEFELQTATTKQAWGSVVAGWVRDGSPSLEPLFAQAELLVQVTLPAGDAVAPSPKIAFELSSGRSVSASLISAYPHVDPRVQGPSFLYEVRSLAGLAPGLNLVARLPAGPNVQGVFVPESAVVWWQGRAWIYQQVSPDHFTRTAIPTDMPIGNGYFLAQGLSPGDLIVLKGADWLLSEEFRNQVEPQGEE